MTKEELRRLMRYLEERVELTDELKVRFELPDAAELGDAGFAPEDVRQFLVAPWLPEMASEVRDTPEYCEPDDPPETILQYARDTVVEYLRKRFEP